MTYHIYGSPKTLAIGVQGSVIKAADRQDFETAKNLCDALATMQSDIEIQTQDSLASAQAEGFANGQAAVTDHIAAEIGVLHERLAAFEEKVQDQIAAGALAATQAIIGKLPPEIIVSGILKEAMARLEIQNDVILSIEIAPAMLDRVHPIIPVNATSKLTVNPALSDHDCVIVTQSGRLVASLDVQMESLAKRWGVAPPSGPVAAVSPVSDAYANAPTTPDFAHGDA